MEVFQSPSPLPLNFPHRSRVSFSRSPSTIAYSRSDAPDSESENRMFILGMGFVGSFFAQQLKDSKRVVSGTCRSDSKKQEWEKRGIDLHLFSTDSPDWSVLDTVKDYTHLLVSIPPLAEIGDPMLRNVEMVRDKLSSGNLRWLCYLSSTSVYGDYGGAWVKEDDPPNPKTRTATLRLAAEEGWLSLGRDLGVSTQILRLGGIYGPGRSLFKITQLKSSNHASRNKTYGYMKRWLVRRRLDDVNFKLPQVPIGFPAYG